jgi:hypothetical protein
MRLHRVRSFNPLVGEWARGPRALEGLERGGDSPEGVSSPRATWSFGDTAPGPSSEAEFRWYGADPLERGGDLP